MNSQPYLNIYVNVKKFMMRLNWRFKINICTMYKRQVWPNSQSSLSVQFVESWGDVIKDHDLGGFSNGCIQSPEPEQNVILAPAYIPMSILQNLWRTLNWFQIKRKLEIYNWLPKKWYFILIRFFHRVCYVFTTAILN